jgi:hypothetical protein
VVYDICYSIFCVCEFDGSLHALYYIDFVYYIMLYYIMLYSFYIVLYYIPFIHEYGTYQNLPVRQKRFIGAAPCVVWTLTLWTLTLWTFTATQTLKLNQKLLFALSNAE